jgi:hypothetical protein
MKHINSVPTKIQSEEQRSTAAKHSFQLNKFYMLLAAALLISFAASAQIQKGTDIDGEALADRSGFSVSMADSNTMAIGAIYNDDNGLESGHVRVYDWNGSTWVQKGEDINGEAGYDYSGYSVSMPDPNTVAIGAYNNDGNGLGAGHVSIYEWNGSAWVQKGVDIDGEAAGDNSGNAVSMPDANTVAIGARRNDGSGTDAGHVRIYEWNGSAWVQKGIDIDGEAAADNSGFSVSMPDANTVAIGANNNDANGSSSGHVRIFQWNGSAWVQKGIDIDGEAAGDYSGQSVSMPDANTLAIGANGNDGNGNFSGHVRVYDWNGSTWVQKGMDIDGAAAGDHSGYSVSMPDPNTVAIGAPGPAASGIKKGQVRVFEWICNAWVQKGMVMDGEAVDDQFGNAVSMPDANTVGIGGRQNDGNGSNSGHVRVFSINSAAISTDSTYAEICQGDSILLGGAFQTVSGVFNDTLTGVNMCDSIIVVTTLTVNVTDNTTTLSGNTIQANNSSASYVWLNCDNNYSVISGEVNQFYTPIANGNYAVELTENGCLDTSACVAIKTIGLIENDFGKELVVYPNPTDGKFLIDLGDSYANVSISITDIKGKLIRSEKYVQEQVINLSIKEPNGVYLITVLTGDKTAVIRLIKN